MDAMGNRLRRLRKEAKLTQAKLGKMVGVRPAAVTQWETGKTNLSGENLLKVAQLLNVSPEYLLHGKGGPESNVAEGPSIKGRFPLISWVAAGTWSTISEIPLEDAALYPCPVACSQGTFVLTVQGVSMEPMFRDGDLVFVDPEAEYKHGSYVIARLDDENEATFKQLMIEGRHKYLKPSNPDWPEQIIPINGNCTIVGVVIFTGRQL